jgi:hypothetical protein
MSFIIGLGLALLYSIYGLPSKEGGIPVLSTTIEPFLYKGMIIIPYNNKHAIHIHHWIIYGILLLILPSHFVCTWYFCFGMVIQGLTYNDRLSLLVSNPYFKEKF